MNDRELLELAAKAAGIERAADRFDSGVSITLPDGRHQSLPKWNPLENDGDALRLAVKLKLALEMTTGNCTVFAGDNAEPIASEMMDREPCAATRRAIVRAAAEIGRNA